MLNWQPVINSVETLTNAAVSHVAAICTTFGLGGGVGIVKFLRHMPAPPEERPWAGTIFDLCQDLASNTNRIGERRRRDGVVVNETTQPAAEPGA